MQKAILISTIKRCRLLLVSLLVLGLSLGLYFCAEKSEIRLQKEIENLESSQNEFISYKSVLIDEIGLLNDRQEEFGKEAAFWHKKAEELRSYLQERD